MCERGEGEGVRENSFQSFTHFLSETLIRPPPLRTNRPNNRPNNHSPAHLFGQLKKFCPYLTSDIWSEAAMWLLPPYSLLFLLQQSFTRVSLFCLSCSFLLKKAYLSVPAVSVFVRLGCHPCVETHRRSDEDLYESCVLHAWTAVF